MDENPNTQFQFEPEEIQPTMIIGLGGSGKKVLTRLKTRFYQTFNKVPENVRLVCLDIDPYEETDMYGEYKVKLTPNEEFFDIGDVPAGGIVKQIKARENAYPEVRTWFNPNIPLQESNLRRGGQQNRQLGRLAFYWNVQTKALTKVLEGKYLELRRPYGEAGRVNRGIQNSVVVYIIASLAGGTGAGMVLDTAFLMRYIANSVGLADQTSVVGVLVLPRVFDMVNMEAIQPNALAALQEIDYFMTTKKHKLSEIHYTKDLAIPCTSEPFNICYAIDAIGAGGKSLVGVEHLFPMIVDAVFLLAASRMGNQAWSNINNLGRVFTGSLKFSSLGVASLVFPAFEIHHLCAAKVSTEVIRNNFLASHVNITDQEVNREVDRFMTGLRVISGEELVALLGIGADGQPLRFEFRSDDRLTKTRLQSLQRSQVYARVTGIVGEILPEWEVSARKRLELNRDDLVAKFAEEIKVRIREIVDSPERGIAAAQRFVKELQTRLRMLEQESDRLLREKTTGRDESQAVLEQKDSELKKAVLEKGLFKAPVDPRRNEYLEAAQDRMDAYIARETAFVAKQSISRMLGITTNDDQKLGDLLAKLKYVLDVYLKEKSQLYQKELQSMDAVRRLPITRDQDIERIYQDRREGAMHKVVQSILEDTGLLALADLDSDQVGDVIFKIALANLIDIYQIRLEDIIPQREKDKERPVTSTEWMSQVEGNAEVFWRYEREVAQDMSGLGQKIQVIGVEDTAKSIYKGAGTTTRSYCSTSNPHMITVLQMEHGLNYRHMAQYRTYESNYKAALRQDRSPHVFPEFNFGSEEDHKWFALGAAYGLISRRGPFWVAKDPDSDQEITLADRGTLADAIWSAVHQPDQKLIKSIKEYIDNMMWGRSVTKQRRTTLLKQLQKFRTEFDWLGSNNDLESEWLKDKFSTALDTHIKEVQEYIELS